MDGFLSGSHSPSKSGDTAMCISSIWSAARYWRMDGDAAADSDVFPRVVFPRTPDWAEHIATDDPGTDVFEGNKPEVVIDALGSAAFAVHLLNASVFMNHRCNSMPRTPSGLLRSCRAPAPNPSSEIENAAALTLAMLPSKLQFLPL